MTGQASRICARFRVSGRVQGVFFRASTRSTAERLGLTGWVRNLADGSVEVLGCGAAEALDELEAWLWRGPDHARVEHVERQESAGPAPSTFSVK